MKKVLIILGVVLIIIGVIAYLALPIAVSKQTIASSETMTVKVGSNVPRVFHLPSGAYVSGIINNVAGSDTDIEFYVFDSGNYNNWISGQSYVQYLFIHRATIGTPFSFRTDKEDDFYLVFGNPGVWFNSDRVVVWSASYDYKIYAPYVTTILVTMAILGGAVMIAGYFLKPKQVSPPPPLQSFFT